MLRMPHIGKVRMENEGEVAGRSHEGGERKGCCFG
jgi:hypothetical protein